VIQHPWLLGATLVGLVALVRAAAQRPSLHWAFAVTPVPFWCYALPIAGTALGWWPSDSPLYAVLSQHLLPICLVLLLLGADLRGIATMGRAALVAMLAGSIGIVGGMVAAGILWHRWLPANGWMGLGALAGSWTGGSMNLLAVKEALGMPDTAIAPVIVVDTMVAYGWMAVLLLASAMRRADSSAPPAETRRPPAPSWPRLAALLAATALAALIAIGARAAAQYLPVTRAVTTATWSILLVTTAALALSLTPVARLERRYEVSRLGTLCLLVLLASIGARVDLHAFRQVPAYLVAGITAVLVHALVLGLIGWWGRIPLGMLATASQANVGGVVSAPLVAAAYDQQLAPVGLLMAILGNVIGTYAGLTAAALCRLA